MTVRRAWTSSHPIKPAELGASPQRHGPTRTAGTDRHAAAVLRGRWGYNHLRWCLAVTVVVVVAPARRNGRRWQTKYSTWYRRLCRHHRHRRRPHHGLGDEARKSW